MLRVHFQNCNFIKKCVFPIKEKWNSAEIAIYDLFVLRNKDNLKCTSNRDSLLTVRQLIVVYHLKSYLIPRPRGFLHYPIYNI